MRLSDLQTKDVINVNDGKRIGNIVDIKIDSEKGQMMKLIIEPNKLLVRFFSTKEDLEIEWVQIVKIGEDVILVNVEF